MEIYLTWTTGQLEIFQTPEGTLLHKTAGGEPVPWAKGRWQMRVQRIKTFN